MMKHFVFNSFEPFDFVFLKKFSNTSHQSKVKYLIRLPSRLTFDHLISWYKKKEYTSRKVCAVTFFEKVHGNQYWQKKTFLGR